MPTIHDLPLEIVERIINIGYPDQQGGTVSFKRRAYFLLATSLVCRDWTTFAQRALWLDVCLSECSIDQFVAARPERYPVLKLWVRCYGLDVERLGNVLRNVRGVQDLSLRCGDVDREFLTQGGFNDLRILSLRLARFIPSSVAPALPFHLTSLVLELHKDPSSSGLADALALQTSITSLDLETYMFDAAALLERLSPLAPQLVTLKIACEVDPSGSVGDFIKYCTRLNHLIIYRHEITAVALAVAHLPLLTIKYFQPSDVPTLLDILNSASAAVTKLDRLRLRPQSLEDMREHPRWAELEQRCREMKIELIVGKQKGERLC